MQEWGERFRQAVLEASIPNDGKRVLVTWLPVKDLHVGFRAPDGMAVAHVYDGITLRRCAHCGKLCALETIRCSC